MKKPVLMAYVLLAAMTCAYCMTIWYATNMWSILVGNSSDGIMPLLSLGIAPLPLPGIWFGAIHWQLFAVFSFVLSVLWGQRRTSGPQDDSACALAMVVHLSWILFAILLHAIGAFGPMLMIGSAIG